MCFQLVQDTWEEVDPDELSYEVNLILSSPITIGGWILPNGTDYCWQELIALGEIVGTESRGLSADTIASLPSTNYKSLKTQDSETDS